jgi:3-oxoacyl-[acyl-carrier-protein] synthase-1
MNKNQRVFLTGISASTVCGSSLADTWAAVIGGRSGIHEISSADISTWPCRLGGEINVAELSKHFTDRKLIKLVSKQDVLGIHAAMKAVEDSNLLSYRGTLSDQTEFNERTGVYAGSPGNKYFQQHDFLPLIAKTRDDMQAFGRELFSEVHPMWLLRILPNNVLAYTGITYGFKGPNHNITNHAVGGLQAIIEAYHAIQAGQIDRAVVVAYDVATEPQALYYYEKLGVLSAQALKPFDSAHDGTILAEGASAVILESAASAEARNANCYAEILGGASASERCGLFGIDPEGFALKNLLETLMERYRLFKADFGMIVGHGNGNPISDCSEAKAIQQVFADKQVPVTAFKWSTGHTLCASGILDTVLAAKAMQTACIPGVANFASAAKDCEYINISSVTRPLDAQKKDVLIINRGFASMNACLALRAMT